ncbi:MAG TPA: right-handed parallel beta-helix repeat-containing protein [Nitrospirales bacterium]|nr:hypothetical protein [Nitrospiraceae bacterium]HNP31121.1 right-handed parallel beta-helix repeat-containing protein [Nitrospirales bacterium]
MEYLNGHRRVINFFLSYIFVLSGIFGLAGLSEAIAKEYFVAASNGNDKNNGTNEAPFLTLEKGVSVLSPGDTLNVRGGTYQRNQQLWSPPSGISWGSPITIRAYQKEKVVIKPLPGYTVFEFRNNSQYIIMDGFIMDATDGHDGIRMGTNGHHIRISNSEIKNAPHQGIMTSNGSFHEFLRLRIHHNGITSNTPGQSHGIYMPGSNNLIEGCEIFNNGTRGVQIYSTAYTPSSNIVRNNRIYNNGVAGASGHGIVMWKGKNNQAYNNLVWGNLHDGINTQHGVGARIYNNTLYENGAYGIALLDKSDKSLVKNNLVYQKNGNAGLYIANGSGASVIENNLVIAPDPIKQMDKSAILGKNFLGMSYDPKFQDVDKYDFHLTKGSFAIGRGLVIEEVETDFDGALRSFGLPFDIGAYAFGAALAPPTNLSIISKN